MEVIFTVLFGIMQFLGRLLFDYYAWILVVAILAYLIFQNQRKQKWVSDTEYCLLLIEVPKDNEKQALSAEQMFASLHGILRPRQELIKEGAVQEHISFEIVSVHNRIQFYIWAPKHLKNFIEGQVYAQYPSVQIHVVPDDYAMQPVETDNVYGAEMTLENTDVLPIRTFNNFEVDPLAGITAPLAKLDEPDEQIWVQILARPADNAWHSRGETYINNLREGKGSGAGMGEVAAGVGSFLRGLLIALWQPPETEERSGGKEISDHEKALIAAANEKIGKLGYEVKLRVIHIGGDKSISRLRIQSMVGAFKQFNTVSNGFKVDRYLSGKEALDHYKARFFIKSGKILNIEELATLYHLPHTNVETPSMVWATTKTAEPPSNLPSIDKVESGELSPIAQTNFRGNHTQFGLKRSDRGRHVYIVGQTGTGKSGMLELLTLSDIFQNEGFAIIDPHGDYASDILKYIPEHRVEDIVYFNPADLNYPVAFNPLEVTDESLKGHISSEVVGALKRMFGYSWGPRLEYILRYTILALLDSPNSTLLGITRMLTEKDFRNQVIKQVKDPVVKSFWLNEFASWNEKFASEAVAPILNKVGAFTANPLIRNIVGQPKSAFDIRKIMDEGKILIVNLSRGQVGEDNAATLGALMVTKIQLAAMSRANLATIEERRPFFLYVDEFQNFATDSFAVILSEARKYGLNLTIANQYVAQLSEEVRDAVFGNVGTMAMFRVGADDAQYLAKYIAPTFEPGDLMNLHTRHFIISMMIDGEKVAPFTATTLNLPGAQTDYSQNIIEHSRSRFASDKASIEEKIARWADTDRRQHKSSPKSSQKPHNKSSAANKTGNSKKRVKQAVSSDQDTKSKSNDNELKPDERINLRS